MCKRIAFLNDCSHKMNKFLFQILIWLVIQMISLSLESIYPIYTFSCEAAVTKLNVYLSWAKNSIYFSCLSALTNPHVFLSWVKFSSSLVHIRICHNQSKLVSANQRRSLTNQNTVKYISTLINLFLHI